MLYFAYGSKMDTKQMDKACGSGCYEILAKCKLRGYRFEYNGHSRCWNGPAGDIVESKDNFVWGVLYKIDEICRSKLYISEGFKEDRSRDENTYVKIDITNSIYDCDKQYEKDKIFTFQHVKTESKKELNCKYKEVVLCGARQHELPKDYINEFLDKQCTDLPCPN